MSFTISSTSINYNDTSVITTTGLTNVSVKPTDSVISIIYIGNNQYDITVKPLISTIYYISGLDSTFTLLSFNETIYVNVTILSSPVQSQFNSPITLQAYGSNSYLWYPNKYLNQNTGSTIICTPLENIEYTIQGTDIYNCITTTKLLVNVNTNLIFTPSDPIIYEGNLLYLNVNYIGSSSQNNNSTNEQNIINQINSINDTEIDDFINDYTNKFSGINVNNYGINEIDDAIQNYLKSINNINVNINENNIQLNNNTQEETSLVYTWNTNKVKYLPYNCKNIIYGQTLKLHPLENNEYIVNVYNNYPSDLITTGNVKITVKKKPMNIIDIELIPYSLYNLVLTRNSKDLTERLITDPILSKKIINFYYTILQTAYRMEWTNKNGISFRMTWLTLYQVLNDNNETVITFEQQWKFFQYINSHQTRAGVTPSNFAFLLNTVNKIYLENPQKIDYIQQ
jgi:hypothetical protein